MSEADGNIYVNTGTKESPVYEQVVMKPVVWKAGVDSYDLEVIRAFAKRVEERADLIDKSEFTQESYSEHFLFAFKFELAAIERGMEAPE